MNNNRVLLYFWAFVLPLAFNNISLAQNTHDTTPENIEQQTLLENIDKPEFSHSNTDKDGGEIAFDSIPIPSRPPVSLVSEEELLPITGNGVVPTGVKKNLLRPSNVSRIERPQTLLKGIVGNKKPKEVSPTVVNSFSKELGISPGDLRIVFPKQ